MGKRKVKSAFYMSKADEESHIYLKKEKTLAEVAHFHKSVEFLFVLKGRIRAFINGERYELCEGDIFFAYSYEPHCYEILENGSEVFCLVLGKQYITSYNEKYNNCTFPKTMKSASFNDEAFSVVSEWENNGTEDWFANHFYANKLFFTLAKNYEIKPCVVDKKNMVIFKFLVYINENYLKEITLKQMAKHFGYSPEYCSTIFNEYMGRNFRTYLSDLRMSKALEFIRDRPITKASMDEIIYRSGFSSPATFYRCYAKLGNPENLKF